MTTSPATSITAAYGPLTPPQYRLAARIANGEDVRFYSAGVHPSTAYCLIDRRIIDVEAATCPPAAAPAARRPAPPLPQVLPGRHSMSFKLLPKRAQLTTFPDGSQAQRDGDGPWRVIRAARPQLGGGTGMAGDFVWQANQPAKLAS